MKTTQNTVIITGGSAGIGLEIDKQFTAKGNKVIITGRDKKRLNLAASQLPGVTAIECDVTKTKDVEDLVKKLNSGFPSLNVVINNAGRAIVHNLLRDTNAYDKASDEMMTNYLSIISLNESVLPLL